MENTSSKAYNNTVITGIDESLKSDEANMDKIENYICWGGKSFMINSSDWDYQFLDDDCEKHYSLEEYLQNIEMDYNYDHFVLINHFIIKDILPKYDNLVECNLFKEDEYGDPANEYYIKFVGDLSYSEEKKLHKNILREIKEYADDLEFFDEFKEISIFLIR